MPFFDPTVEEELSFLGVLRHTVLEGPLNLVRFSSASGGYEGAYGRKDKKTGLYCSYWMYASEVEELLDTVSNGGPYGVKVIKEASSRWAICDDWSDMGRAWLMSIPSGRTLNAYFGFAKFQPKVSRKTQDETGRKTSNSYPGGSLQLVVRLSENEFNWVSGPLRTLDISSKKLRDLYV